MAAFLRCPVDGDESLEISGFASLGMAEPDELVFIRDGALAAEFTRSRASVVIAPPGVELDLDDGKSAALRSPRPALDFSRLIQEFAPPPRPPEGIAVGAHVDASAKIDSTASIAPGVVIGPDCVVGARTVLAPNVTLVADVEVGSDCWLHAGVILREQTRVGDRVLLQPGVVLGADGFGYVADENGRLAGREGPLDADFIPPAASFEGLYAGPEVERDLRVDRCRGRSSGHNLPPHHRTAFARRRRKLGS